MHCNLAQCSHKIFIKFSGQIWPYEPDKEGPDKEGAAYQLGGFPVDTTCCWFMSCRNASGLLRESFELRF